MSAGATMASTLAIRPLELSDLSGLLALTRAAHWNQDESDWRTMLEIGSGWGIADAQGALLASTLVLPYAPVAGNPRFAWISMVLVRPDQRRRGHASRLLRHALVCLARDARLPILDATPAGREVYRREGFVDRWGFERLARAASTREAAIEASQKSISTAHGVVDRTLDVRPIAAADWSAIAALDARAFGADRLALLRSLAERLPAGALAAWHDDRLAGFVLGRPGYDAAQIGPLVARSEAGGIALLERALGSLGNGALYVDVPLRQARVRMLLGALGFEVQRPFTRMLHLPPGDATPAPGDDALVMLVAGPELG